MRRRDIFVVGASAGGVEALRTLVGSLPGDLPASVFVVLHLTADSPSLLATILARSGPLPALVAQDDLHFEPGCIYVAPPDQHLLVEEGVVRLSRGPRQSRSRPAIDALFRSAAHVYTSRVVGVVLTGTLDDGVAGMKAVKSHGGVAVVQDPADALFPGMPQSVLAAVEVDHCLPLAAIGPLLARLSQEEAPRASDLAATRPVM